MRIAGLIIGWLFTVIFGFFFISMLMLKNWVPAIILLLLILLVLPPVTSWVSDRFSFKLHPVIRIVLSVLLLFLFGRSLIGGEQTSIYSTPEIKEQLLQIYDQKMEEWPVPYEDIFIDTRYGTVHVIKSGSEELPPLLLLHASGVAGWSWKFNVEDLSQHYLTYAVDLIGDAGKSEYADLSNVMTTGMDQAALYAEIMDSLGVENAYIAGASEGGFIASNIGLYTPERVRKIALLGPMGYSGATQSIIRITFAQLFPLRFIHNSTFSWAFSKSEKLEREMNEWFHLLMSGTFPKKVPPMPLAAEQRQSLNVPVLMVLGERDNLVGDPVKARELVQDIPNIRVEVVPAGHLMAGELPNEVDAMLIDFFVMDE